MIFDMTTKSIFFENNINRPYGLDPYSKSNLKNRKIDIFKINLFDFPQPIFLNLY